MNDSDKSQALVGLNTPPPRARNRKPREPDTSSVLSQLNDGKEKVEGALKSTACAEIKLNPNNQRTKFLTEPRKGKQTETIENLFLESLHWLFKSEINNEVKEEDIKDKIAELFHQQIQICPTWEKYDLSELVSVTVKLYSFAHNIFINGMQTPPGVMQVGTDTNNVYTVSWGNRRLCAHKIAFGTESPIVVGIAKRKKAINETVDLQKNMIIENSAREDKSTLEGLLDYHGFISLLTETASKDTNQISKELGKRIHTIRFYNRLIKSEYFDLLAKGGFGKTLPLITSYDTLVRDNPKLIKGLVKSAAGDLDKLAKMFKEMLDGGVEEKPTPAAKPKKKARGRQVQYISLPKVKSPKIIKSLITGELQDNEYFQNIDWDDNSSENLAVITNAFKLVLAS